MRNSANSVDLQMFSINPPPGGTTPPVTPPGSVKTYTEVEMQKISSDRVSARVNELNTKYAPAQRVADKLAKAYGFQDLTALEREVDAAMQQLGTTGKPGGITPPDVATQTALKAQDIARDAQLSVEEAGLLTKADYAELVTDKETLQKARDYAKKNDVTLETAVWALQGPAKAAKIRQDTELRVREEIKQKLAHGGVIDDNVATPTPGEKGLTSEEKDAAKFMKMSEGEFKELGRTHGDDGTRYNIDDFIRAREKNKAKPNA